MGPMAVTVSYGPFEYVGVTESVWRDAERHISRGLLHLASGNAVYAEGSFRKAARRMDKAEALQEYTF